MEPQEKQFFSPKEVVDYLNTKFSLQPPLNLARLARLRREERIKGEKLGTRDTMYTREVLENVKLEDVLDKRRATTTKA
jgi:hypothetical protein